MEKQLLRALSYALSTTIIGGGANSGFCPASAYLTSDRVSPPHQETRPPCLSYCTSTYSNCGSSRGYFAPPSETMHCIPLCSFDVVRITVPPNEPCSTTIHPKASINSHPRPFRYGNQSEICLEWAFDQIPSLRQG